ncbi:MAG: flagellar motor switch protein FliG [Gammaproteobacteria bacterium]|nr:flagellar motor switch protein FliG [Gammaproteobacteria bacterium]
MAAESTDVAEVSESTSEEPINGPFNAAILLMAMGEENAANVLMHMEPSQVQAIGEAMNDVGTVSQKDISATLDQFINRIEKEYTMGVSPDTYLARMLDRAIGKEAAIAVMSKIDKDSIAPTLDSLKWMPDDVVAKLIRDEHPQFIAIVLSYLNREKSASVLETMEDDRKVDILVRLSRLDKVHPVALKEIDSVLEQRVSESIEIQLDGAGGIKTVAEILNEVPTEMEEIILEKLAEIDSELSASIKEKMFVFENLLAIDDRGMQTLLRDVSSETLVCALKGANQEIQTKIFSNMSSRAATLLKDDLDAKGPMRLAEVEEAQKEILVCAMSLAEEGKINLGGKGDDFV